MGQVADAIAVADRNRGWYCASAVRFHEDLVEMQRRNGFEVETGISGCARAGGRSGDPEDPSSHSASDIDGISRAKKKPGVAYHAPLVDVAPVTARGTTRGRAVNVMAALALRKIMERENIPGTLILGPGVAEELVGAKAWFVRDGRFRDVNAVFFTHVGNNLGVTWGAASGTGLVSVETHFAGEFAHGAGASWRGRSALDAVEMMNIGWNFRREHLRPDQRSHDVISDGGDEPTPSRNGLPCGTISARWTIPTSGAISTPASASPKAVQQELGNATIDGPATELDSLEGPQRSRRSGGSDDIGDISWVVPTVWAYFRNAQTKSTPLIGASDPPAIWLNTDAMREFRPKLTPFYSDETRFDTDLEQLGIWYPMVRGTERERERERER